MLRCRLYTMLIEAFLLLTDDVKVNWSGIMLNWSSYLWIAFGGALGAMSRAWVGTYVQSRIHSQFPWGTFLINASGSLLLGFIATLLTERVLNYPNIRPFITIGFIGAYTTFSTFEYESLQLGSSLQALSNLVGSVIVGYGCVWIGTRVAYLIAGMVQAR
jgi:fluoride exporter